MQNGEFFCDVAIIFGIKNFFLILRKIACLLCLQDFFNFIAFQVLGQPIIDSVL